MAQREPRGPRRSERWRAGDDPVPWRVRPIRDGGVAPDDRNRRDAQRCAAPLAGGAALCHRDRGTDGLGAARLTLCRCQEKGERVDHDLCVLKTMSYMYFL